MIVTLKLINILVYVYHDKLIEMDHNNIYDLYFFKT